MTRNVTWKERAVPGKAGGCPFPRPGAAGGRSYSVYKSFNQSLIYPHSLDISFYYTNTCNKAAATASHSLLNNFFIIIARGRKSPGILPFWGEFSFPGADSGWQGRFCVIPWRHQNRESDGGRGNGYRKVHGAHGEDGDPGGEGQPGRQGYMEASVGR